MTDLTSAYIGLAGVIVGSTLTIVKDFVMHFRSESKDSIYLSIQLMALLDRFADECTSVSRDEGDWDSEGRNYEATTSTPVFNPISLDVQWKTLPPLLLYRIMDLPQKTVEARSTLAHIAEFEWDPPDNVAWFEERRIQFAELGLEALDLSSTLRLRSGIPQRGSASWDPASELRNLRDCAAAERAARLAREAELNKALNAITTTPG